MFGTVDDGTVGYNMLLVMYFGFKTCIVLVSLSMGAVCLVLLVVVGRVADAVDMVLLVLMRG